MNETNVSSPRAAGSPVVDFELRALDGQTYSSKAARQNGLVLAALFKTGCGTCKYSLPYLQRFYTQYAAPSGGRFQVWGISQDDAETTQEFMKANGGADFPMLLDATLQVSGQYGLTNVPDLYLLGADSTILASVVGHFGTEAFNSLAKEIAARLHTPYLPVVRKEDNAPDSKPG